MSSIGPSQRGRQLVGLGLVLLSIGGLAAAQVLGQGPDQVSVVGSLGGEKRGLLDDPLIQEILLDRYGIEVDARVEGSIEMVTQPTDGLDFLWPSSEVALALYEEENGPAGEENIFNSPIVLYSYAEVTDALAAEGLVTSVEGIDVIDTVALAELITGDDPPRWEADLGLERVNGAVSVTTTDPAESNSGNMFSGLLATAVNGGQVPDDDDLDTVGQVVVDHYAGLGRLQGSSGDLFSDFLALGVGSNPIIAGYENQLIEFGVANPRLQDVLTTEVDILYPSPTVFSSHPIIPLTEAGQRLVDAFADPELLDLAWTRHGFRAQALASANDPADLEFGPVPAQIRSVVSMPRPSFMIEMVDRIP